MSAEAELVTLANGLRIATASQPSAESVSLAITLEAGARDEETGEHGLAHLLEHMAFKGTGTRSAKAIVEEIERVGGDINAETGAEHTTYTVRVLTEHLEPALDVITDLLVDPRFNEDDLRLEKGVIAQEIGAALDAPDDRVSDLLAMAAYGDHALGRPILGTLDSVAALTIADIEAFRGRLYTPGNMVVAAAGAVDHEALVRTVEKRLGHLQGRERPERLPARRLAGRRAEKGGHEVNLALGWTGASTADEAIYAVHMASLILGGGMSSRLFQSAREAKGLCYGIDAAHWAFVDDGLFVVQTASAPENTAELIATIAEEIGTLADSINEEETSRARAQTRAATVFSDEHPGALASRLARHTLLFGRPLPRQEVMDDIASVTRDRIREVCARMLSEAPAVSVVGPRATRTAFEAQSAMRGSSSGHPAAF